MNEPTYPILTKICEHPRLYVLDGFLREEEIQYALAVANDADELHRFGINTQVDNTGFSFEFPLTTSKVLQGIDRRLERLTGISNLFSYSMRYRRYEEGEGHPPHVDSYMINGLTLILTAVMYLNHVQEGGETHFPAANPSAISLTPRAGRLALWFGHLPDGSVDPNSRHESRVIRKGRKSILSSFIYQDLSVSACEIHG